MDNLIMAHGDGDGILCGAALKKNGLGNKIIFSQPFLIHKKNLDKKVVIADIAIDHSSVYKMIDWAVNNKNLIYKWFDHHTGSNKLVNILPDKFTYKQSTSCLQLLKDSGYDVYPNWLDAANALDSPLLYPPTRLSERINAALKSVIVNPNFKNLAEINQVQQDLVNELINEEESKFINKKIEGYKHIYDNTMNAVCNFQEIQDGIFLIKLDKEYKVDKTKLFLEGYKLNAKMVMIQHYNNSDPVTAIASRDINLLDQFKLATGCKNRIMIGRKFNNRIFKTHNEQLEFIMDKVN